MPVFLSYSHEDKKVVSQIATQLVDSDVNVWFDKWELRPGDSLIAKIQEAVGEADCLCVVLSPAAVESEWCKKELNAGLMRELDEKRVLVVPVLVEECKIPMLLREKMYADFREDFDAGMESLLEALAPVINDSVGRTESSGFITDYAWEYGDLKGQFHSQIEAVSFGGNKDFSIYTHVRLIGNDMANRRWSLFRTNGVSWLFPQIPLSMLESTPSEYRAKLSLEAGKPEELDFPLGDAAKGILFNVNVRCRLLGTDNGKTQLFPFWAIFDNLWHELQRERRRLTPEEREAMRRIVLTPLA